MSPNVFADNVIATSLNAVSGTPASAPLFTMKGTIATCLQELVEQKFGVPKWHESLKAAGLPESQVFTVLRRALIQAGLFWDRSLILP